MSSITRQEVERLAGLARLAVTPAEVERLASQLDVIVDAVAVVSQAVDANVPATSHPLPLTNVFRTDQVQESLSQDAALSSAPAVEQGQFRVPQILGEEP
ncbi:MAG: Asp-tRNA(Asn)/Glu-tRNA(Gln) amidotransferase subunit GatC [Bifidobacteriaceae bacterium]|jgi:aspartyl-tRNA(Asn)/glutamyl-tRNA(Gln) amidotransferase subunit C|nr:Asp-tRNA(Asn)/Glu-tRNA(Gln) amidotransferase subunit GatC [Bifidobacteriaceae bacterium]